MCMFSGLKQDDIWALLTEVVQWWDANAKDI